MSRLYSDDYQNQLKALHAAPRGFGNSGAKHAPAVISWANLIGAQSVLDYGAGAGSLSAAIHAAKWPGLLLDYDPAISGKDIKAPADLVVCTDVLEHVEPRCLSAVLADLSLLGRRGFYFCISTQPAHKQLPDGRNAHLIVQPPDWWEQQLQGLGDLERSQVRRNNDGAADLTLWIRRAAA